VAQVIHAGHRVLRSVGGVEAGGDFLEAARGDQLGEGGVHLVGLGLQRFGERERLHPAISRGIVRRMTDHERRFVFYWIVRAGGGGEISFTERDRRAVGRHVPAGPEDLQGICAHGPDYTGTGTLVSW